MWGLEDVIRTRPRIPTSREVGWWIVPRMAEVQPKTDIFLGNYDSSLSEEVLACKFDVLRESKPVSPSKGL
jgi:hypothetical protein